MEQNLAPYDLEFMKLTMLKQEETFNQQVHELHRLYQIQRLLMRIPPHKKINTKFPRLPNEKKHIKNLLSELEIPSEQCFNMKQSMLVDHLCHDTEIIDLTLGLGTCYTSQTSDDNYNKQCTTKLLTSDSVMTTFSSSSSGFSSHSKKSCIRKRNDDVDYHNHLRQQDQAMLEQPPWCLQVLSLNMT